ncbi:MAG: hypothetical protein ACRELX_14290 [Longimicrobiales bacterium]
MRAAVLLCATLLLTSCDDWDVFGPGDRFEGFYNYAGTVNDEFGDVVVGSIRITRARGDRAYVDIDWEYLDRGSSVIRIESDRSAIADIDGDGRIEFDFEGDLFIDGGITYFRLSHDGWLNGRTLTGDWRLETDLPTDDRGTFTARRE